MILTLRSPFKQPPLNADAFLPRRSLFKDQRRFKLKTSTNNNTTATPTFPIRAHLGNIISDFVSRFPSVDTVAPALGLASGLGLYIRNLNKSDKSDDEDVDGDGEWMLFATPSSFNRFVLLRCPSICFLGPGDVNEKLLKLDRHDVRFDCSGVYGGSEVVEGVEYQRLCVPTDDGGVICLDFPAHLNLEEDDGLDTTLLLVPGSTEGSMDRDVQLFASQSLKRGCFPVVFNPRGCSGSPITTPRMFTAADSDDVRIAAEFISKRRPRTAIMGVGWGYGANMLTKYLAEVGHKTPLTAATCIDNPFDLPEVSKTFQQKSMDQKLLGGLKNILRSNKENFQGRIKGFDVEKALVAESVREFESFISMISYGFQTIEDFYSACSTHYAVKDIRVPVLFIQSDSEIQPLFYAPHSLIADNPFTSLLLSSSPSYLVDGSGRAASRCHYMAIEWLAAVELGILKGRHPLTKNVKVSLGLLGGRGFSEGGNDKLLDYGQAEFSNDLCMDPMSEMLDQNVMLSGDEMTSMDSAVVNKEPAVDQSQGKGVQGTPQLASKEDNSTQTIEEKNKDSVDTNKIELCAETGQAVPSAKSDPVSDGREVTEYISAQVVQGNSKAGISNNASPSNTVSEAFEELAGVDDSTQVAVNSVNGSTEGMVTLLEEKADNGKETTNVSDIEGEKHHCANNINPDMEEKINIANPQKAEIKDSSVYDGGSMELHPKIINKKVNASVAQFSSQGDTIQSWSHGASGGNRSKDEEQANSSNLSCAPQRVADLSENPPNGSEKHMVSNLQDTNVLDMNNPTPPNRDCYPKEDQLKVQAQTEILSDFDKSKRISTNGFPGVENITDTENTNVGTEWSNKYVTGRDKETDSHETGGTKNEGKNDLDCLVKRIVMDSIEAEILSRLRETEVKEISHNLAKDLELVSSIITQAVKEDNIAAWSSTGRCLDNDRSSMICGNLHAEHIVKAVSFTVSKTHYLRRILPVGVIVSSSLAALKKHFSVIIGHDNDTHKETLANCKRPSSSSQGEDNVNEENNELGFSLASESQGLDVSENSHAEKNSSQNDSAMAGAEADTGAAGSSQDSYKDKENTEAVTKSTEKNMHNDKEPDTCEVETPEAENNIVKNIADKAISIADPVVPKNENGHVDQERIVSTLGSVGGQNGGILKLVGKSALLWGGMQGAMSLTNKFISILHLSDRPLFQRLLGFGGMVILLWSPIYIPLLPTLVRGWATTTPSKSAELSCIIGLYVAVTVLITLWGKRIRGYERPLKQYGLNFTLPMLQTFMTAYIYGALIVLSIQYFNTMLSFGSVPLVTWIPLVSSTWLRELGKILLLVAQGTLSATGMAFVEELLFRSWLPAEISKEYGFHVGIIVAGFTFSVFQRSLIAIPGFWLLSLALAGAKERSNGSLSTPIGLRAGMMTTVYVLQKVGFLTYGTKFSLWLKATDPVQPVSSLWLKATDPVQPVSGIVGLAFCLLLAVYLYPWQMKKGIKAAQKNHK